MKFYLILAMITLTSLVAQIDAFSQLATWDRALIQTGQWWRILTGNITHTNLTHWAMNMAALWLICLIFTPSMKRLIIPILAISGVIGVGLFFSDIQRYVGFSGVLHGLFLYYTMQECLSGKFSSAMLLLAGLIKVGWEQWVGPSPISQTLIDAPIAIQAHLIGGLCGVMLALYERRRSLPHF